MLSLNHDLMTCLIIGDILTIISKTSSYGESHERHYRNN